MHEQVTFCRICAAACGAIVTVDGDRVVAVRGDRDHPVSQGYLCPKGRALGDWHHHPDRLDGPLLDGRPAGWAEVLGDLAARLGPIRSDHPDAIAMYLATGFAYDSAGQVAAGQWMGAVGSSSFYSAATVDNAPVLVAAELVAGHPMANPRWDPSRPGLVIMVGSNPVVSHGYGTTMPDPVRQLRRHRAVGGQLWVLDPRRTETAHHADVHLALRPGSDVEVLAWLASRTLAAATDHDVVPADRRVLEAALAPFTLQRAVAASDLEASALEGLAAAVHEHRGAVAMLLGTGVAMARDGVVAEWLRWVLLAASGSLDVPTGMGFHRGVVNRLRRRRSTAATPGPQSRPDLVRVAGQQPAVALVDEIEAGHVRALVVVGGNPLAAFPEPARVRAALARLEVLAVVDVVHNELTALATHVLAATGQLERADLTLAEHVALRPGLAATEPVVAAGPERRASWWILASVARAMGLDLLGGADPDTLDDVAFLSGLLVGAPVDAATVWAAGPHGWAAEAEHGWVRSTLCPDGHWNLAPPVLVERLAQRVGPSGPTVLIPHRTARWSNSVCFTGPDHTTDAADVHLHPDEAQRFGLDHGASAVVRSRHGSLAVRVVIDATLRPGTVTVPHGRAASPVGQLTSGTSDVDRLSAMPLASGLEVEVGPAGA